MNCYFLSSFEQDGKGLKRATRKHVISTKSSYIVKIDGRIHIVLALSLQYAFQF